MRASESGLRWWLRRYARYAQISTSRSRGGAEILCRLGAFDPDGWRCGSHRFSSTSPPVVTASNLLESLSAPGEQVHCRGSKGDRRAGRCAGLRRRLKDRPCVPPVSPDLRQDESSPRALEWSANRGRKEEGSNAAWRSLLLGLMRTSVETSAWKSFGRTADADAGVNNLNQTVFQLRRLHRSCLSRRRQSRVHNEHVGAESP